MSADTQFARGHPSYINGVDVKQYLSPLIGLIIARQLVDSAARIRNWGRQLRVRDTAIFIAGTFAQKYIYEFVIRGYMRWWCGGMTFGDEVIRLMDLLGAIKIIGI